MKFFWKMFFSAMFVSIACFAFGSYILISTNFNTNLDNEVQRVYEDGDIVYQALCSEFNDAPVFAAISVPEGAPSPLFTAIGQLAKSISINNMNQNIPFGIVDADGASAFSSLNCDIDNALLASLSDGEKGYTIKKTKNSIYIQAIRPANIQGATYYIETVRDLTPLFDNQKAQYQLLIKIMLVMFIVAGLLIFMISKFLMHRVVSLTRMTKAISSGNFNRRANEEGNDEFAMLSQNFNRMADNLEENINMLKEEAEKKELFVGAFSHELKTPLTSVIGYSDMLRRQEMSPEQVHVCAEYIFSEGKRLETLSMRLLELIILRNQTIKFVLADIKQVFDEACQIVAPQLAAADISLICNIQSMSVNMEPELMKTVFINLLDNARKAIENGGQISVNGSSNDGVFTLEIHDTGRGMEPQELSKIREAFYMVDKSRARRMGGAGLGLAICDEVLKLHDFEIAFESMPGSGTTVTLSMGGKAHE